MDKSFEIQKQVRDNVKTFETYLTDLQNWEADMKRKEAALSGAFEQDLPPVRSKLKKGKPVVARKKPEKRISSFDYQSWEKFDADKACEDIDMAEVGPVSLDSKQSQQDKLEKLRDEAQYEKERGNKFVKETKWDEAISCYTRAIDLVKDDAIYYANRGLCYLKKESLHQAEKDCTEALRIDPTYVKALQRRASAREKLGSLRAASQDLNEVLRLEPHNNEARRQLNAIKERMGTKGSKSKSSPSTTPTLENKPITTKPSIQPRIVELNEPVQQPRLSASEKWRNGVGEPITVIKTVKKPPHMRSKRPLKRITINEIPLGNPIAEKPSSRLKIIELDDKDRGDSINNDSNKIKEIQSETKAHQNVTKENKAKGDMNISSPESVKLITDSNTSEKDHIQRLVAPVNSVQFMAEWKNLKGKDVVRSHYLSIIDPSKIPSIFANALESDVLSDLIVVLHAHRERFQRYTVAAYLAAICDVKRFTALAMFLSAKDKTLITDLLSYCKSVENISDQKVADLKNKYEI